MSFLPKIRVAVLFGGRSAEHEVSLRSAENVIRNLDPERFDVIPIGIDKQGNWTMSNNIFARSLEQNNVPKLTDDESAWFTPDWVGKAVNKTTEPALAKPGHQFDVVFPVVHGSLSEDGTLQGLLELAGLPYVGCGVLSSAVGMDKDISKRLIMQANIPVAPFIVFKKDQWQANPDIVTQQIEKSIGYPCFIKPANTGSSVGITKVKTPEALAVAIQEALKFDVKVIIEKALNIVELEVAVLESLEDNADPIVSVVGEIKSRHEFYSYEAKYLDENGAELLIPATSIDDATKEEARNVAKKIFRTLDCEGMARIDLFYDKDARQICFNEINTIPGFTQISMYPKLMQASGIEYAALLTHLIHLAIKRQGNKSQLLRSYTD